MKERLMNGECMITYESLMDVVRIASKNRCIIVILDYNKQRIELYFLDYNKQRLDIDRKLDTE